MNPEEIINIKNKIMNLEESIESLEKVLSALKIDKQILLQSNEIIPPGIACRITYDSHGLILKGENLRIEDIPELPIEKITGLKKHIIEKNNLSNNIIKSKEVVNTKNKINPGSGVKINYDENGYVISSSDLLPSDIPNLSIDKINGLYEKINLLESIINNIHGENNDEKTITPGTFPKISFGSDGKILNGYKLSIDDIPIDLINRINTIESRIPSLASQLTVNGLIKDTNNKVNANNSTITPGSYTKVNIDSKGLVTSGDNISINDLPTIGIKNIDGLESILKQKADYNNFIELNNAINSINNSTGYISDQLKKIQNTVSDLNIRIDSVERQLKKSESL